MTRAIRWSFSRCVTSFLWPLFFVVADDAGPNGKQSQGVARQLALAALAACNNDPDRAQVWIMTHGVTAPAPRPAGRPSGAGGVASLAAAAALARAGGGAGGHAADSGGESDEEAAEAAFQRDLERAQLASEALSKEEERTREAAFVESARAAPIETFEDTSFFLVRPAAALRLSLFACSY